MLTITGGKLTTFRRMAKLVVDRLVERDGRNAPCRTHEIPLGMGTTVEDLPTVDGVDDASRALLVRRYGYFANEVLAIAQATPALRERTFELQKGDPLVMGIVNGSPESFSDGGRWATLDAQVERALELVAEGADLIDVGGESGVTGSAAIAPEDETRRVVPLVERLAGKGVTVSVDTWKPEGARAALAAGAALINDVSGLRDPGLAAACAPAGPGPGG